MIRTMKWTVLLWVPMLFGWAIEGGAREPFTVLIDPAHGGEEVGVLTDGMREKDMVLKLALLLQQEARRVGGPRIELTRMTDRTMGLSERLKSVAAVKPHCLVGLHVNAGFGKSASGYEALFPGFRSRSSGGSGSGPILKDMAKNKTLNESVRLAQHLQTVLDPLFPRKGRGLRETANPLLEGVNVPAIILEVGFATHVDDRRALLDDKRQLTIAAALVKGLDGYFRP